MPHPQETNKYRLSTWSNLHKIKHTIRWNHKSRRIPKMYPSPVTSGTIISARISLVLVSTVLTTIKLYF